MTVLERERYDALDWVQQTAIAAEGVLDGDLMDHIIETGDPAARMALTGRDDLGETRRARLRHDRNPWVRALADGDRLDLHATATRLFSNADA